MQLGRVLAESGFFPDARDASQAIVKVLAGREIGLGPIASMSQLYVQKGKVGFHAYLIAALMRRHGYDYRIVVHNDKVCELEISKGAKILGPVSFTIEDAQKAKLTQGDNWQKYPRNMLFSRAITNAARFFAPEVFGGYVLTPEEIQDEHDVLEVVEAEIEVSGVVGDPAVTGSAVPLELGEPVQPQESSEPADVDGEILDPPRGRAAGSEHHDAVQDVAEAFPDSEIVEDRTLHPDLAQQVEDALDGWGVSQNLRDSWRRGQLSRLRISSLVDAPEDELTEMLNQLEKMTELRS